MHVMTNAHLVYDMENYVHTTCSSGLHVVNMFGIYHVRV
jgi:hypothetical protein